MQSLLASPMGLVLAIKFEETKKEEFTMSLVMATTYEQKNTIQANQKF